MKRYKSLSRHRKAVLNLALVIVLIFALWAYFDYPLPTSELQFRRMERQNLRRPSDIVFRLDWDYSPVTGARAQLSNVYVGVSGDEAVAGYFQYTGVGGNRLEVWPLGDGPSPVPLAYTVAKRHESGYLVPNDAMLFLNVPPEAVRAQLKIQADEISRELVEGERLEKGGFFFWFPIQDSEDRVSYGSDAFEGACYTLWLYNASEELILEQEGVIPEI